MCSSSARTGADLKAVAGIHPSLHAITPADTPQIKGEVLVHMGGDDPFAPPERRTAFEADMSDAGVQMADARLRRGPPQLHQRHPRRT